MSWEFEDVAIAVRDLISLKLLYSGEMDGEAVYERTDYDQDSVLVEDIRTLERHGIIENSDSGLPPVETGTVTVLIRKVTTYRSRDCTKEASSSNKVPSTR